jgi:hypothetical protein
MTIMSKADPREAPSPAYARWATPLLNDPRDVVFVALMMQCAALAVALDRPLESDHFSR